jgi:hypothetical protein
LAEPTPKVDISRLGPEIRFKIFREDEEATKILQLVALERSYVKTILVVPLLSIVTALSFLLFLYWYPTLRKKFFYSETTLNRATHLFV